MKKRLIGYRAAKKKAPPKARARIKKRRVTKGGRNSDPKKLAWIRKQDCLIWHRQESSGSPCSFELGEAHHDRPQGARATDKRVIPLCGAAHHRLGPHSIQTLGREGFEAYFGVSLTEECDRYEAEYQRHRTVERG